MSEIKHSRVCWMLQAWSVHLARKGFLYSATNGGLLQYTETFHWGTRDARGKPTAEAGHTEPEEGWWQLHLSALFTLVFPKLWGDALIHWATNSKLTGLAFTPWLCIFTFSCCYFQEGKNPQKPGSGPNLLPGSETPDLIRERENR